jgi:hypothetical protein
MRRSSAIVCRDWRLTIIVVGVLTLGATVGCSERTCLEPGSEPVRVELTWPPSGAVVGDSVVIRASVVAGEAVSGIKFFVDGAPAGEDATPPYEFSWHTSGYALGSMHRIWARTRDRRGNCASSDTAAVHCQWLPIAEDPDDPWPGDVTRVCVRSTQSLIEFRIEVDSEPDEIDVFLDTDRDQGTGYNALRNPSYAPNDIGADFDIMYSGSYAEFDRWTGSTYGWDCCHELARWAVVATHAVELAINLTDIGSPSIVDIVVASDVCCPDHADFVPDSTQGHLTYTIDGLYLGE